jgi:hypothetical protein
MASDPFTLTTEMVVAPCQPTQGGEQALQRIRMEHHYGKGPFVGRADHDATVAESLHYVDVFWDAWGQAYLTSVLGRVGVRDADAREHLRRKASTKRSPSMLKLWHRVS